MNGIAAISDLNQGLWALPSSTNLVGWLIGLVIGLVIGLSLSALIIKLFVRVLFGYWPSFNNAFWASFCALLATVIVNVILRFFFGITPTGVTAIVFAVLQFFFQAAILGTVLEHPEAESGKLGIPKGILLYGTQLVVGFCLGLAFFFVLPAGAKAAFLQARAKRQATLVSAPAAPLIGTSPVANPRTIEEAQREAVRRYPELAVAGSAFNREFRARYDRYRKSDPKYFLETNWPISLAEETNGALKSR